MKTLNLRTAINLLLAGIVLTFGGGWWTWRELRQVGFHTATAEIEAVSRVPIAWRSLPRDRVRVRYRFVVDGAAEYGERLDGVPVFGMPRTQAQKLVDRIRFESPQTVRYNPRRPHENVLLPTGSAQFAWEAAAILLVGLLLINYALPHALPRKFPPDEFAARQR